MGEVGTHDNERFLIAPYAFQCRGNLLRRCVAGCDRQHLKLIEQHL